MEPIVFTVYTLLVCALAVLVFVSFDDDGKPPMI